MASRVWIIVEVASRKFKGWGWRWDFSKNSWQMFGDRKIPLDMAKKVGGIQACFGVSGFWTNLGEINVVEGWGGLASGSPSWFYFGLTRMISHTCLEYGTGVRFGLTQSVVVWYVKVHDLVGTMHMLTCVILCWWLMSISVDLLLFIWLVCDGLKSG